MTLPSLDTSERVGLTSLINRGGGPRSIVEALPLRPSPLPHWCVPRACFPCILPTPDGGACVCPCVAGRVFS